MKTSIPSSRILNQAAKIAAKIEGLQVKLHALVGSMLVLPPSLSPAKPSDETEVSDMLIRRRPGRPLGSLNKKSSSGASKLIGKPRPVSPTGPLGPAVLKVLRRYGREMKVDEVLIGLEHDGYVWTAKNPRQTLYVRIGSLAGVSRVKEGLYIATELLKGSNVPVGTLPERVSQESVVSEHIDGPVFANA